MSLELALQQNTAAINTLIELLKGGAIPATAVEEPKATKPEETKKTEKVEVEKVEETVAQEPISLTYDGTASYIVKVGAKLGKAGVAQVLNKFGAEKNLKEVDPSNWASVITACQELLA